MTGFRGRAAATLTALALALPAAGCGSGGESAPAAEPGQWPRAGAVDIPQPERPTSPVGRPTRQDARRFATYLMDSWDYMLRTSFNVQELWRHQCTACLDLHELYDEAREKHLIYEYDELDWETLEEYDGYPLEEGDPSTFWGFTIRLKRPELRVLDDRGREVDVIAARTIDTELLVGEYEGGWWLDSWRDVDADGA